MVISLKPTKTQKLFGGAVTVVYFGLPHDFSGLSGNLEAQRALSQIAKDLGVREMYVPRTSFANAVVAKGLPKNFRTVIEMEGGIRVYSGLPVDGVQLESYSAFAIASADCPTLIARCSKTGTVVAAHAALKSLVEMQVVHGGSPSLDREHESVVGAALAQIRNDGGGKPSGVQLSMVCGIKPANYQYAFDHSEYGEKNEILVRYLVRCFGREVVIGKQEDGCIDLFGLGRSQFSRLGGRVDADHFWQDDVDTFSDTGSDGGYVWHSNRRGGLGGKEAGRNCVLVIRHY